MKIGFAQTRVKDSLEDNIEQCLDFLVLAGKLELNILLFPEMQFTSFFPGSIDEGYPFQWAEGIPGPTIERFQKMARETSVVVVLNYMERFNHEFHNSSPIIDSTGKLLGVSRMIHVPLVDGYYGQNYFTPSCGDFNVYPTRYARIGIMSSYDMHFPEVARSLVINEAQIILIPGFLSSNQNLSMIKAELKTIAHQNSIFVGMSSRVGSESQYEYVGNSMMVGPRGEILVEGSRDNELVITEVDLDEIHLVREKTPYLKLRRPDEYMQLIRARVNSL